MAAAMARTRREAQGRTGAPKAAETPAAVPPEMKSRWSLTLRKRPKNGVLQPSVELRPAMLDDFIVIRGARDGFNSY